MIFSILLVWYVIGLASAFFVYYVINSYSRQELIKALMDIDKNQSYKEVSLNYDKVCEQKKKHPYLLFLLILISSFPYFSYSILKLIVNWLFNKR